MPRRDGDGACNVAETRRITAEAIQCADTMWEPAEISECVLQVPDAQPGILSRYLPTVARHAGDLCQAITFCPGRGQAYGARTGGAGPPGWHGRHLPEGMRAARWQRGTQRRAGIGIGIGISSESAEAPERCRQA
jgi:hypothetical protein